nr:flagellar hook protein FlgE [Paracoccus saliphilus]
MSMNTALSGLSAAQTDIAATSHNIANVATIGFRGSRAEFADIFNQSPYTVSRTTTGTGTQVTRIAQDFGQGSIVGTGNRLDLAIEGPGFFALQPMANPRGGAPETLYSRAGAFSMSADGRIVNASGQQLLGWPVASDGAGLSQTVNMAGPLQIPLLMGEPRATSAVALEVRLPSDPQMGGAQAAVPPAAAFDPDDATTWAHRTPVPLSDAEGRAIAGEAYFVRMSNPTADVPETSYQMHLVVEGMELAPDGNDATVTFDAEGQLVAGTLPFGFAAEAGPITLDLNRSRLTDAPFEVRSVSHDGQARTQLTTLDIDNEGTIFASYGSDNRIAQGKLALVNFANPGGLRVKGGAAFAATADSGAPLAGSPGDAGFGSLRSGALEKANVDLTEELVNLITAQRNYQASAKAMETSSGMMQTILNLRT